MRTTYYAQNEIRAGGVTIPAGEQLAVLETPDNVPVDSIVRALNNGLATVHAPTPSPAEQRDKGE